VRSAGGTVELISLTKCYGDQQVLKGIDLRIGAGEFFSLLGPSGCGKTTTLRLIGGFERADGGEVRIDGVDVSSTPPERRPVNTVFQSYALFPHLTVEENVAFGLRFADVAKRDVTSRVADALELVQMTAFARRKPHRLSGGQQQRVALARALVLRPRVLLLDEPLGALDAKLRKTLQSELAALQRDVGITFVYVTHDQEEALTMSDRIAVMDEGEVSQVGTPREIYDNPSSAYVASFLGVANLFAARHLGDGRLTLVDTATVLSSSIDGSAVAVGDCSVVVRPERIRLTTGSADPDGGGDEENVLRAVVVDTVYVGPVTQVHLRAGTLAVHALVANDGTSEVGRPGDVAHVHIPRDAIRIVGGAGEAGPPRAG
jgi:spermidine/putrescine transport system ATP-binding protein